ncbi:MAG: D-2-hydroxyacid dehydrogenase [Parvibaculaceae bacterium]
MTLAPTVIIHGDDPAPAAGTVKEAHPDLDVRSCSRHEALPGLIAQTQAEIVYSVRFKGTAPFPRAALVESGTVRWVSVGGSGTDHLHPWDPARVTVTNAAGVAAGMMAEYVLGTMLSFSLGLPGFAAKQQARQWDGAARLMPVAGRTVLILGLGKTGMVVARRCKALGMTVLGVRASPRPMDDADEVHGMAALPSLWPRADVIVCCVPLLESTRGLVGAEAFAAMKPETILIDVSRGGIVDEAALMAALGAGRLKGVARDVFAVEPLPADHPLWAYDNVIVTPHCSSVYHGWDLKSARMFADNLARYRKREPLANVVDPVRGY